MGVVNSYLLFCPVLSVFLMSGHQSEYSGRCVVGLPDSVSYELAATVADVVIDVCVQIPITPLLSAAAAVDACV